jgi:hypothetical protein
MSGDAFQVHFHPKLGVVIYDPLAQMSQAVLRALPSSLRLGGFHGLRRLQRHPLHLRHLQLRFELAPAQSRVIA